VIFVAVFAVLMFSANGWTQTCGNVQAKLEAAQRLGHAVETYYRMANAGRRDGPGEIYNTGARIDNLRAGTLKIVGAAERLAADARNANDRDVVEGCGVLEKDVFSLKNDIDYINLMTSMDIAAYKILGGDRQWHKVMQAYKWLRDAVGA
jgi:hypothetical protein